MIQLVSLNFDKHFHFVITLQIDSIPTSSVFTEFFHLLANHSLGVTPHYLVEPTLRLSNSCGSSRAQRNYRSNPRTAIFDLGSLTLHHNAPELSPQNTIRLLGSVPASKNPLWIQLLFRWLFYRIEPRSARPTCDLTSSGSAGRGLLRLPKSVGAKWGPRAKFS